MNYTPLHRFILLVLLREGKSNAKYHLYRLVLGKKRAARIYFGKLFEGCDLPTYLYYCSLYEKQYRCKFTLPGSSEPQVNNNRLTGRFK